MATVRAAFLRPLVPSAALAVLLSACEGLIGPPGHAPCTDCTPVDPPANTCGGQPCEIARTSRVPRLTHVQWENSVRDLLQLDRVSGLSASFITDPAGGLFDNNTTVLDVTPALWSDYQRAAETLAERISTDATALARLMPADAPADPTARAHAWITHFGRRVFRRPLTESEVGQFAAVYAAGAGAATAAGSDPFVLGVQYVLEAFLQSPHFVYRVEASAGGNQTGVALNGYERATRLSYALWNTTPDDTLLDAAASGALDTPAGVRAQAERLLADPRATATVEWFHHQLLDLDHYLDLYKNPARYPGFSSDLGPLLQRETQLFVDEVIFRRNGALADLLTAPFTFVNQRTAPFYGLGGSYGDAFERVDLDATQRAGLLTQLGFLSAQATAEQGDPIHRGVFINRRLLCTQLPPPPMNVPPLPPASGRTHRETVAAHTGPGTCGASCHGTLINPVGFAFEHFDAVGQWRDTDNGVPVNALDEFFFDGRARRYDGAVEFSRAAAESTMAHECYVQHWLRFAYGRPPVAQDRPLIADLGGRMREGHLSIRGMILELTQARPFLMRIGVAE
jgi:hypothetical protein